MQKVMQFQAATQFLPSGGEVFKIVKYLDLATNMQIVLVSIIYTCMAVYRMSFTL